MAIKQIPTLLEIIVNAETLEDATGATNPLLTNLTSQRLQTLSEILEPNLVGTKLLGVMEAGTRDAMEAGTHGAGLTKAVWSTSELLQQQTPTPRLGITTLRVSISRKWNN